MNRSGPALLLLLLLALPGIPRAECQSVQPVACPECFAVAVIPDTQFYTFRGYQNAIGGHLELIPRYLCENKSSWTEPSTGKQMPILLAIQLGDLVQHGDRSDPGPLSEWVRIDAAFDHLDACGLRYLVTTGNHDYVGENYEGDTLGYQTYFGANRWTSQGHACTDPSACSGNDGDWFLGVGDTVTAGSRNNTGGVGSPGPSVDFEGRHRAGLIRSPAGQRFLFLGLEMAFDFPPAQLGFETIEGDDAAWPRQLLSDYPDTPTLVFHHSMLLTNEQSPTYQLGVEGFRSDSIPDGPAPYGSGDGMRTLWNELIEPYPQIFALFTGHVTKPSMIDDFTFTRADKPPVHGFLRNFQNIRQPGTTEPPYGAGWTVMAVFDPETSEIRVRSYRVDDTDFYADPQIDMDHDGTPAPTECLDVDWGGFGERAIPFEFERMRAVSTTVPGGLPYFALFAGGAIIAALAMLRRMPPRS